MQKTINFFKGFCFFLSLFILTALVSCNKEPVYTPVSTARATIDDFWLEKTISNTKLNRPYQGMIKGDTAIHMTVDFGTDITAIEPTVFSTADSIAPSGKQNFSNPVKYTVSANGKKSTYTVRITVSNIQFPTIKTIASGFNHVMALKTDGTVWVCGDNSSGQLGIGDLSARNIFTQVPVYNVEKIFSGEAASVIKLKDGTTWSAGNRFGQLGIGHKNNVVSFTRTPFLDDATELAITFSEVFALKQDGTVWGAGRNLGQLLAQGNNELSSTFVKIPISSVKQISGNANHILVQKNNGEIWGWGENNAGQLGVGDNLPRYSPVIIPTPFGITKLFAGASASFLTDNSGKIWATGANTRGQLGLMDQNNRNSFTEVVFFNTKQIDAVVPHLGFTSFKDVNGTIWNVGDNSVGQMGLGSIATLPVTTPTILSAFVTNTAAGNGNTSYIIKSDGTLWAWGSNMSGALGTGTDIMYSASPIQIK